MAKVRHEAASCFYCRRTRRPVGKAVQLRDGWAVQRFFDRDPYVSGLATKGEVFKVLFALKHKWRSVTVNFMSGRTRSIEL
jgi:hypothetical protein